MTLKHVDIDVPWLSASLHKETSVLSAKNILQHLGGAWSGSGGQAPCPVCQPERRADQNALSVKQHGDKLLLWCFKSGCEFSDIVRAIGLSSGQVHWGESEKASYQADQVEYQAKQFEKARALWSASEPIVGTKAEAYLRGRGITCDMPASLRFVTDIHHSPSTSWCMAMVADVSSGGVHRTYFDKKGIRLRRNTKMMLGPFAGGAVHLTQNSGLLVVCEGIETGLSLASGLIPRPASIWATLSTSGMKALELPHCVSELIIATDGDEAGQEAGSSLARRASKLGWLVKIMQAPQGHDWNDVLRNEVDA